MYGCESWTITKAKSGRIDSFELWCWRRLLRDPWTAASPSERKSVLNIHWKNWNWRWNSITLAIWCKELTHLKWPWCSERLKVGGEGDDRGWGGWMASLNQWAWVWANSWSWWWRKKPGMLYVVHGVAKNQTQLSDWIELTWTKFKNRFLLKFCVAVRTPGSTRT